MTTDADRRARACLDLLLSAIGSQRADHYMDAYNTVRAALAGREWWQDISTAPKDGTKVILLTKWGALEGSFNQFHARQAWSCLDSRTTQYPTHWMPLPSPPAQQQNSGGSYGLPTSPSEGMEPSSNAGSPESRPDAVEGLENAISFFDGFNELLEPHKTLVEAAKLQLKRQQGE